MGEMIYVVMGTTGKYSDRQEWPVCAYQSKAEADKHISDAAQWLAKNYNGGNRDAYRWKWIDKNVNPFDPGMQLDYTGTNWFCYEVPMGFPQLSPALPPSDPPAGAISGAQEG